MVKMYLAEFILLSILCAVTSCPSGSIAFFKDRTQCLYFNATKTQYLNAETVCAELGGHLASVNSMAKNIFLSQHALSSFTDSSTAEFWFGANSLDNPDEWNWMDGMPFEFINWNNNEPKNTSDTICGAIIMNNGKWISGDCYKTKPFVCLVNAVDTTTMPTTTTTTTTVQTTTVRQKACIEPWIFYNLTGYCYLLLGGESFDNAENVCKNYGGHLASIHGVDENLFVTRLAYPNEAYIGLKGLSWKWNDDTPFDYENWAAGYPKVSESFGYGLLPKSKCGLLLTSGEFVNTTCRGKKNFVCKKPAE